MNNHMYVLHLYRNNQTVARGVMGCQAWAKKIAPVLLGMGYAVRIEPVKMQAVPQRNEFERKQAEQILNKAYALFDNLVDQTN
jgi:hypothetical protein